MRGESSRIHTYTLRVHFFVRVNRLLPFTDGPIRIWHTPSSFGFNSLFFISLYSPLSLPQSTSSQWLVPVSSPTLSASWAPTPRTSCAGASLSFLFLHLTRSDVDIIHILGNSYRTDKTTTTKQQQASEIKFGIIGQLQIASCRPLALRITAIGL